ncbi:MAG: hypothetical protein RL103_6 [Pseudomonadota bacterium]
MNVEERDQLLKFLASLRQVPVASKDLLAESLIQEALGSQKDALYQLVQRCLALELALGAAQTRLKEYETQPDGVQSGAKSSDWGLGLMKQVGTLAVGTTLGVVAGQLIVDNLLPDGDWLDQ